MVLDLADNPGQEMPQKSVDGLLAKLAQAVIHIFNKLAELGPIVFISGALEQIEQAR